MISVFGHSQDEQVGYICSLLEQHSIPFNRLDDACQASDICIICFTQDWNCEQILDVLFERKYGSDERPPSQLVILPIVFPGGEVAYSLRHTRFIDFRHEDEWEHNVSLLIESLRSILKHVQPSH